MHEHPSFLFPGTGRRSEIGLGKGKGTTLNIPLPPSTGDDRAILAFDNALDKIAEVFRADFILVSAGFDGYEHDPLAHLNLGMNAYGHFGNQIGAFARAITQGRVLSILEGGYYLPKLGELCMAYIENLIRSL
jgi:acetoin utilization deacetylase AcuC-like enzyme